jgi:hypothetical protein
MNQRRQIQQHSSFNRQCSPLPAISRQGCNDVRFSGRGSEKITTVSIYKAEMEKTRGVKSTDTGKKINCPLQGKKQQ